jgi:hypothetical protein
LQGFSRKTGYCPIERSELSRSPHIGFGKEIADVQGDKCARRFRLATVSRLFLPKSVHGWSQLHDSLAKATQFTINRFGFKTYKQCLQRCDTLSQARAACRLWELCPDCSVYKQSKMSQRHLLTCPNCQYRIPVETAQAGRSIRCIHCGESTRLGTLREIRALPAEFEEDVSQTTRKPEKTAWSPRRRAVFTFGMLLLVAGGIAGGYAWNRASAFDTDRPEKAISSQMLANIDKMDYRQIWATWESLDVNKLQEWREPDFLKNKREADLLGIVSIVGLSLAGMGLAGLIWASIAKNEAPKRPLRRPASANQA